MAEIRFRKKEVVSKDIVNAVVFESPDKRIQVVVKPKWMKESLLAENIKVFSKHGTISLPIEKMMAALGLELLYHEGWNIALRTSWDARETAVESADQLRSYLKRALEQSQDRKAVKKTAPLS